MGAGAHRPPAAYPDLTGIGRERGTGYASFCEGLERAGSQDWQVRQAEQAVRLYLVNFLQRTDWHRAPASPLVDEQGQVTPLVALEHLRCAGRRG